MWRATQEWRDKLASCGSQTGLSSWVRGQHTRHPPCPMLRLCRRGSKACCPIYPLRPPFCSIHQFSVRFAKFHHLRSLTPSAIASLVSIKAGSDPARLEQHLRTRCVLFAHALRTDATRNERIRVRAAEGSLQPANAASD
jgi:Fe-S-cluster containining protein